jgi:hypothetical protein
LPAVRFSKKRTNPRTDAANKTKLNPKSKVKVAGEKKIS